MNLRAVLAGVALLALAAAGGAVWMGLFAVPAEVDDSLAEPLPLPPMPPRIATGLEYDRCLAMLATDPSGAAGIARAWQARGGAAAAEHCLALSEIALGAPAAAAARLQTLAGTDGLAPVGRAILFSQSAQAWLMAGDPARSYDAAGAALALSPDDATLLIERATAASLLERYAAAAADLARALAIDPRRPDALVLRASALRHVGQLATAQAEINRALTLDPDNPEALLERGILRQRQNDAAGARADWERAIILAPDSPAADLAQQNLALLEAGPPQ